MYSRSRSVSFVDTARTEDRGRNHVAARRATMPAVFGRIQKSRRLGSLPSISVQFYPYHEWAGMKLQGRMNGVGSIGSWRRHVAHLPGAEPDARYAFIACFAALCLSSPRLAV